MYIEMRFKTVPLCSLTLISAISVINFLIEPHQVEGSNGDCGVSKVPSGLIVRGSGFSRGDFPWIVALMQTKNQPVSFFCGGTLISSTFVITAAHCLLPKQSLKRMLSRHIFALFGAHNLNNHYEAEKISLSPKNIVIHEDWNQHHSDYDADIALLEFQRGKIIFSADSLYIQPICLWKSETEPPTLSEGIVTGWGKSEDPTKLHENEPKLLRVKIQSNEDCVYGERELFDLTSLRTFCAGLRNGSGVCHGDSGGGLFLNINGVYYLKGIVSSSLLKDESCDVSRNAVYTNVIKFKSWIEEKTKVTATSTVTRYTTVSHRTTARGTTATSRPFRPVTQYTRFTTSPPPQAIEVSLQNAHQVFCELRFVPSRFLKTEAFTCVIERDIANEEYAIGSNYDTTVESFLVQNTSVASIPRDIGAKFPNLYEFQVYRSRITNVRNFFFKDMKKLLYLSLTSFIDATVEANAFKDLVSLKKLFLDCSVVTLDRDIFATTINLEEIYLNNNKIKTLDPRTFKITGGRLRFVNLQANVCIDKLYWLNDFARLEADITAKCQRMRNG